MAAAESYKYPMKKPIFTLLFLFFVSSVGAQRLLSLSEAIEIAKRESYASKAAALSFMSSYWSYRQYRAGWLPSLALSGTLMNYDRSIVEARDYETGRVSYVDNNSLYNSVRVSVNQNLPWADGTLSLRSDLSRFDQFDYDQTTYNSTPLLLYYNQPLRRYSSMRWNKRIYPLQFERAKRNYLENLQSITINVTGYYFAALSAQSNLKQSLAKHKDLGTLYAKTNKKMELGLVTKGELLQLELSMLNAEMSISNHRLTLDNALFRLFSYLNIADYKNIELVAPTTLPQITISSDEVVARSYKNSAHTLARELNLLAARQNLEWAKANTGLQVSLQAQIGLTQSAGSFKGAYNKLKDNEIIGITFSLPIYDWGLGGGKKRVAKAQLELAGIEAQQDDIEFEQEIRTTVMYFNNQAEQCRISRRALEVAEETYLMAYKRYENGAMTVTDFNTANNELESAQAQYLSQLNTFWAYYYTIQRLTLYDYIRGCDIDCDFDKIVK